MRRWKERYEQFGFDGLFARRAKDMPISMGVAIFRFL
jgi:hypothetical protein